ncbi:transposase [Caldiplasma sukawensis]
MNSLYHNDTDNCGRPNIPVKTKIKVLFSHSMFNMVDEQSETLIKYRISFINFLDFPDQFQDAKTIWLFREKLSRTGRYRIIWNELQRKLELKGIRVKKGSVQDATFITSGPRHLKHDEQ